MPDQIVSSVINKQSLRHGLLLGVISIVLAIVFRIIDPVLQYTNLWVLLLSFVVMITLLVILSIDVRKKIGGFWNFGQAFKSLIIMSVVITVLSILFSFVLFKYVDPDMPQKVNDATMAVTSQRLEKFGMDPTQIDAALKTFTDGEFLAKMQPTLINELKAFGGALIFYAVIDLIIAACVKRKPPIFAADSYTEPEV